MVTSQGSSVAGAGACRAAFNDVARQALIAAC